MPTLPDIKGKVVLDDSQLARAGATATKTGEYIKRGMQTGTTHTLRFTESLTTMLGHFGNVPPVVNTAARSIESMTSSAAKGMSGAGVAAGAAVAGLGLLVAAGGEALHMYTSLGERVLAFSRVTGASAEESSRLVQVFDELGVAPEVATNAIVKLSRAIETTPKKLEALGIEVARDSKGNVDLAGTLVNVTTAYQSNGDAAQRNLIAITAFGRGGADLIPILAEDAAQLQRLEAQVRTIYTEEDLKRIHDYQISQRELKRGTDDLGNSVGQALLPAWKANIDSINENVYVSEHLDEKLRQLTGGHQSSRIAITEAGRALREEYEASLQAQSGIDQLTASHKAAADAAQAQADAENKLIQAEEASINSAYALKLADVAVSENAIHLREAQDRVALSSDKVAASQQAVTDAARRFGTNSPEYRKAVDELRKAQDDLTLAQDDVTKTSIQNERNILAAAAAARKLQEDTDLAATGQHDAAKETQAYVDKLYEEEQALDPNSPLRQNIQGLIDEIGKVPTQVTTRFFMERTQEEQAFVSKKQQRDQGFASGGRPPVGVPVWVGEHGPEIWTPDQPGTITPNGGTPPPAPAAGSSDIHVHGPLVQAETNADAGDIAREAGWELTKMRRNF